MIKKTYKIQTQELIDDKKYMQSTPNKTQIHLYEKFRTPMNEKLKQISSRLSAHP